jgi:hypothetical protein
MAAYTTFEYRQVHLMSGVLRETTSQARVPVFINMADSDDEHFSDNTGPQDYGHSIIGKVVTTLELVVTVGKQEITGTWSNQEALLSNRGMMFVRVALLTKMITALEQSV